MEKMKAKDFITLGIFTVLFFVIVMAFVFGTTVTVVTYAFAPAFAAIPGAIIYMLMRAKVTKPWGITLSGVVMGLLEFLVGAGVGIALGFIIGALIAEGVSYIGKYKKYTLNTLGYALYMCSFAIGTYAPMVYMTEYVDSMSESNSVNTDFLTRLHEFMSGPMVALIVVVTFLASILGAIIAKAVLKKHFEKAGIITGKTNKNCA